MRHVSDGMLRARADGELTGPDAGGIERHLASCQECRARAERIALRARAFDDLFALDGDRPAPNTAHAFTRLQARRRETASEKSPSRAFFSARWGAALTAFAAIVLLFASAPTRATARKLLGIFRAKTVVAVPLEQSFLAKGKGQLIGDLLSDSITVTRDEKPRDAASRREASEWAGFPVRLPAIRRDPPRILRVEGARSFHLTVDMKRLEVFLDLVQHPGLRLPPELAGAQIHAEIERGVRAVYGECPDTPAAQAEPSRLASCLDLIESPAVTVTTQPELDLRQIAGIGLQVSGMTAAQAEAFSRTIDWTSTAAIPLPRESASYESVGVDGVRGVLVVGRQYLNWPTRWSLIWVREERVYQLGGFGDPAGALKIAESIQ